MRTLVNLVLVLAACTDTKTIGEQQTVEAPKKVAEAPPKSADGSGSAKPAKPPSKLGKHGVQLRGSTEGDYWINCEGDICKQGFAYDPATRIATIKVEADPGVELRVPGATLVHGGEWKLDVLDLLARVEGDGAIGKPTYKLGLEVHSATDVAMLDVVFDLSNVAEKAFVGVVRGKRFAFAQDATSRFTSDALVRVRRLDKDMFTLESMMPAATFGEVDLVAVENATSYPGPSCNYVDDKGARVVKARLLAAREITVYARRTGGVVARRVVQSPVPPCPEKMLASAEIYGEVDEAQVEAWEKSLLRLHPGESDAAPPKIPALGKQLSPEEGGDLPSRFEPLAARMGMRDPLTSNRDDVLDSITASLGDDYVAFYELRKPKVPKGGSAAVAFKGDYAIAVVLRDHPDPGAAQKLVDLAVAKWPDVKGALDARLPGYKLEKDKYDLDDPALTAFYSGAGVGAGTTHVLRKVGPRIACRSTADRMVCAAIKILATSASKTTAATLLAKLP